MQVVFDTVQSDLSLMLATYVGACMLLMSLFVRIDAHLNARQFKLSRLRMARLTIDDLDSKRLDALQRCCKQHEIGCTCFLRD